MPADFALTPVGAVRVIAATPAQTAAPAAPAAPENSAATTASKRPLINPSLHVDLALNLVVLQFKDDNGEVTHSIPSEKQLKAYREKAESAPSPVQGSTARALDAG